MGKSSQNKKKYSKNKILDKINNIRNIKFKKMEDKNILDQEKEYNIRINKNKNKLTLDVYYNKNKVLTGYPNFFGIIKPNGMFLWSYMIPGLDKRFIEQINKIKSFSHLFENSDDRDMMLYHSILTQDSIVLNKEEINKLFDLILYLSDDIFFFNQPNSYGNMQLIYLSTITEQYT